MSKVKFAAYGTLREGSYNYARYKRIFGENFNKLGTTTAKGLGVYAMNRSAYPFAVKQAEAEAEVDIIEASEECFKAIQAMEHGAGYETITMKVDDEDVKVFTCGEKDDWAYDGSDYIRITNWIEHEKSNRR